MFNVSPKSRASATQSSTPTGNVGLRHNGQRHSIQRGTTHGVPEDISRVFEQADSESAVQVPANKRRRLTPSSDLHVASTNGASVVKIETRFNALMKEVSQVCTLKQFKALADSNHTSKNSIWRLPGKLLSKILPVLAERIESLPGSDRLAALHSLEDKIPALSSEQHAEFLDTLAREVPFLPEDARGPAFARLVSKIGMLPSDKQRAKLMAEFACDIKHLPATARGEAFAHWINAAAELRLTPAQHCDVLKTIIDRIDDLPDDAREAAFMQLLGNIEAQSSFAQQATLLNILIDWISDLPDSARSRAFTRLEGSINALPLKFGYELLPGLAREVWEVPVGARGPALAYLVSKIVMLAPEEQATLMEELEEQLELEESPYREQSAAFAFLVDISLPPQLRANVLCDLTGQVVNLTNLTPKERLAARKHLFLTIATLPPELQEKPLEALRQSAPAPITTKLPEATSRIRTVG